MQVKRWVLMFVSLLCLSFLENINRVAGLRKFAQEDDKKLNVKDLLKENNKMNRTVTKLKDMVRKLKDKIQNYNDDNEKIKALINQKKEELNQLKKKKLGAPIKLNKTHINIDEETSGLLNVKGVKNLIDKFSDFQIFNQHIQNQFLREKELRESLDLKLKELYSEESKVDNIYNNIETLFSGRLTELSYRLATLQSSHYNMEQRIKQIEQEEYQQQNVRSKLRSGMKNAYNNKLLASSEYSLFNLPNCASQKSCSECLGENSCVWCNLEKKCLPGNMNGPSDGSCMTSYIFGTCPESFCEAIRDCGKCTENEECGWCDSKAKCIAGNKFGPTSTLCEAGKFVHMSNNNSCNPDKK